MSKSPEPQEPHITLSSLIERGWTKSMVTKFLGDPDKLVRNPKYRSGPPMRLYKVARIEAIAAIPDVKAALEKIALRRPAAKERVALVVGRRRDLLVEQARQVVISVAVITREQLLRRAIRSYNSFHGDRAMERGNYDWQPAAANSDAAFLERIQVNFIRHNMTRYDGLLEGHAGKVGVSDANNEVRGRIFDVIAERYPYLADECQRQSRARGHRPGPGSSEPHVAA